MKGLALGHCSTSLPARSSRAHAQRRLHTHPQGFALAKPHCPAPCFPCQPELPSPSIRRSVACCASSAGGDGEPSSSQGGEAGVPWQFGYQINERYLQLDWGGHSANEMTRRVLSSKLNISLDEVDKRLEDLSLLLPDMVGKLSRMRSDILISLTADVAHTTHKLLGLRDLFPGVNVSLLVSRWPYLLSDYELPEVSSRLDELRQKLPGVRVEALIDREPQIMKVDIDNVLANIKRILPSHDPKTILLAQPHMVLDMPQAGLHSALDVEGGRVVNR